MRATLYSAFHKNLKSIPIYFDVDIIFFNELFVLLTLQSYTIWNENAIIGRVFNITFFGKPLFGA